MQTAFLLVYTIMPTAILFVPGITSKYSKNDAWISTILAGCMGFGVAYLASILTRKYPSETVVQFSEKILGKWFGKAMGLIYALYFLYVGYFVQREFSDFMITFVLPKTPIEVVIATFTLLSAYGLYLGLEVLGRSNSVVAWIGFSALFFVIAFITKDMKLENLQPILQKTTWSEVFMGALAPGSWMSECAIIMMFAPYMDKPEKSLKMNFLAMTILTLILTLVVVSGIGVLGPELLGRLNFPFFNLVKYVEPAEFLERIDPIFITIWITGMVMKFSIYYFTGVLGIAQSFKLKSYRPLVLPTGLLLTALSLSSWENIIELKEFSRMVFPPSVLFVTVGCTFLLALGEWFRRLLKKENRG
ncbi:GerAB/ArcD/ProY family transporter [Paenibacillus filicis]|uniref:GerAB/ArcD/ProY family transporter n=1 Tax=Paenibacillus gyeongsangnamensis TaxID=3388067 RepID=A0ABT4Q3R2_9BACL|nr:GerAB/ArcD/ProY family transporter [Paenibacillus filicis]MCZ8511511.1 GerAB/ArcD/ProY family transporter [Paenibacillus filicis]